MLHVRLRMLDPIVIHPALLQAWGNLGCIMLVLLAALGWVAAGFDAQSLTS